MGTRREFIRTVSGATVAFKATQGSGTPSRRLHAGKPLRVLILGGTGFIGPHFVRAAVYRGHSVSVFNRGTSTADLPTQVERLVGDREFNLRSIEHRDWDIVLDLPTQRPSWVRSLGRALQHRVRHYTFISTTAVYKDASVNAGGTDESNALEHYSGSGDPYSNPEIWQYGALKVLCEREAQQQFPGKVLTVRPGYMVGPGDPQEKLPYWIARIEKGGEILAPGDPLHQVQFIDVRDVAEWTLLMAERNEVGTYNALGPDMSMTMCEMLGGVRGTIGTPLRLHWIQIPWNTDRELIDKESLQWGIWRFVNDGAFKSDRARAKGLVCRPFSSTVADTFNWMKATACEIRQFGIEVGGKRVPWNDVLQREREIIARWLALRTRFM